MSAGASFRHRRLHRRRDPKHRRPSAADAESNAPENSEAEYSCRAARGRPVARSKADVVERPSVMWRAHMARRRVLECEPIVAVDPLAGDVTWGIAGEVTAREDVGRT